MSLEAGEGKSGAGNSGHVWGTRQSRGTRCITAESGRLESAVWHLLCLAELIASSSHAGYGTRLFAKTYVGHPARFDVYVLDTSLDQWLLAFNSMRAAVVTGQMKAQSPIAQS